VQDRARKLNRRSEIRVGVQRVAVAARYIDVVATNCEQTYHRYLRPGEEVSVAAELTDVVGPKRTALGEGFFITQKISWQVGMRMWPR
jgi:hypothetical protein